MGNIQVKLQRERLLREVRGLLEVSGQNEPPFNPEKLAPYVNVARIEHVEMDPPSVLIPTKDGFVVKISTRCPKTRQRVLCAHELAHTFFYDSSSRPPVKLNPGFTKTWHEEGLCNELAAQMLMPEKATEQALKRFRIPSLEAFTQLMQEFDVSSEFLAWRLAALRAWRVIIVLFGGTQRKGGAGGVGVQKAAYPQKLEDIPMQTPTGQLKVWKVHKHPDYKGIRIRIGATIASDLGPSIAFKTGTEVVKQERWFVGRFNSVVLTQSKRIEAAVPHVVSIITIDPLEQEAYLKVLGPRMQMSLF